MDDSKAKVVWINGRFLTRNVSGVERVATELLNELAANVLDQNGRVKRGQTCYEFCLIVPGSTTMQSPWKNIPLVRHGRLKGHLWEQLELPGRVKHDMLLSLCNTGPLFVRNHYLFLHDAQPFAIPQNFSWAFRTWYKIMFWVAGRRAKKVLVNSEFTKRELNHYLGLNIDKMSVCALGGDHVLKYSAYDEPDLKESVAGGEFLLAVSSLNPNKNFKLLTDALGELSDRAPNCVIVGQAGQRHFVQAKIDSAKIKTVGYVSDEELCALYRQAACLVFPSFYEGFGLPPLEAMTLGCPVIVSQTSSMPEVGGDAVVYCDPNDSSSLVSAIKEVFSSEESRKMLSEKGRLRAQKFTWKNCCDSLLNAVLGAAENDSASVDT